MRTGIARGLSRSVFRVPSLGVAALTVAGLSFALAGCSSSGTSTTASSTRSTPVSGSASASASSTDPDAGVLTGTQLKTALVSTAIPSGYAIQSTDSQDSGSTYQEPTASAPATPDCTHLEGTSWVNLAGYESVSFAQNDYLDKDSSEEFLQEVDAYRGTTAQNVMTALGKMAGTCPSFTDSSTSSTVKVAVATGTSLGDGTVTITLTDPQWQSSMTLVAVRVGQNVISVLNSATGNSATYAQTLASSLTSSVTKLG